jgi:hypothetical protein
MTCTAWVELTLARMVGRKYIDPIKTMHCMAFYWSPFVRCFVYKKSKVKFMHSSKTQYTTEKKKYIFHTHKTHLHTTVGCS